MKRYDLYIFDFDMTLFDSKEGVKKAYRKAFAAVGFPFDEKETPTYILESLDSTFRRFSDSPCKHREFVAAFINESGRSAASNAAIFPETAEVLKALSDDRKRMCIASGAKEEKITGILSAHGLLGYFDHIIGYERTIYPKPSPYSLDWCISQYTMSRDRVCYVGDSPNDMLAAKAASVDGIYISRGDHIDSPYSEEIHDLRELLL